MAFTSTITGVSVFGNKRIAWGTYSTSSTDAGGDITTGLSVVDFIALTETASAVTADCPVVNETLPLAGGVVTIVQTASADGYWFAFGE